ncbi:MAG TPA: glycosyltransferase family 9 protein, partial [Rhodocyclaceae bacterium]|nr:glycosyltransferase family 9 protein [Rhodocyclaceae bacterium]
FAGSLDLPALWHLLAGAALLVCPDSGVAHLAKLTATPTLCLFGQGNDRLFGAGRFFSGMPFVPLIEREMPCRDQNILFGRALPWVQRCARRSDTCKEAVCMRALEVDAALAACERLLAMAPQVS